MRIALMALSRHYSSKRPPAGRLWSIGCGGSAGTLFVMMQVAA
ncbi:hypothetical protein [Rhizobium mesoamericanum]